MSLPLHDLHVLGKLYYFCFINAEEAKDDDLSSLLNAGVYFESIRR